MNNIYILLDQMRSSIISMDLSYSQTIELLDRILEIEKAVDNEERPQGEWYKNGQSFITPNKFLSYCCSNCHSDLDEHIRIAPNFCPNCGAEMRKGEASD